MKIGHLLTVRPVSHLRQVRRRGYGHRGGDREPGPEAEDLRGS